MKQKVTFMAKVNKKMFLLFNALSETLMTKVRKIKPG